MVNEISKRLTKYFDVVIYCTDNKPGTYSQNGIPVHAFRGYTTAYNFSPSLYRSLKKVKCDLIHSHSFPTFMPLAASSAKGDKKLVFNPHFHILGSTLTYTLLRKIYEPTIGYYLFKTADLIVCFSSTEKFFIRKRFGLPANKFRVIYHGANIHEVESAKPYDLHEKIILYVGRLEKYKNVQMIIKSLQYLPEYQFYVVGKGSYEASLKKVVNRSNLRDRVKFLGYLKDEDMYRWLKTCTVLVQLSKIESGFSITCLQALAAGKPVIVNDNIISLGETADLFKGKGVFPFNGEGSAYELARLIEDVSSVQVHPDLGDFDWDTTARKFRDLYLEVLNGGA